MIKETQILDHKLILRMCLGRLWSFHIDLGDRADQGASIVMLGRVEDAVGISLLNDTAILHDSDL